MISFLPGICNKMRTKWWNAEDAISKWFLAYSQASHGQQASKTHAESKVKWVSKGTTGDNKRSGRKASSALLLNCDDCCI